jgi:hypothetical protein
MNPMPLSDEHRLTLAIASLYVDIACNTEQLCATLRHYYRPFVHTSPSAATLTLTTYHTPQPTTTGTAAMQFFPTSGRFVSASAEGHIDIGAGQASLHLFGPHPLGDIDYCLRIIYALLAFQQGGLLVHGAGLVQQGRALIFFGHSGSGKTTIARHSTHATLLNDDLVLLLPHAAGWHVHATPFWNPSQAARPTPGAAPLAVLLRLVQAPHVALEPIGPAQAAAELLACVPLLPGSLTHSQAVMALVLRLLHHIPSYRLYFLPDASFWQVVAPLLNKEPAHEP